MTTPNVEYNVRYESLPAGHAAPPRPPVRVDPGGVRAPGPTRSPRRYGYARRAPRRSATTTPRSARPPSWPSSRHGPTARRRHDRRPSTIPELSPGRAGRRLRLGQVHLRPPALRADRGDLLATSAAAWSPTTRTTSPPRRTPSTCCTTSPASGCAAGRLTVVDATNVQPDARAALVELAREHDVLPVAIVLDVPEEVCWRAQRGRGPTATSAAHVIAPPAPRPAPLAAAAWTGRASARCTCCAASTRSTPPTIVVREAATTTCRDLTGPFDIIGDVHGCRAELETLLAELGYAWSATTPAGRSTPRTPRAAPRCSSATWSTAARTPRACCAW